MFSCWSPAPWAHRLALTTGGITPLFSASLEQLFTPGSEVTTKPAVPEAARQSKTNTAVGSVAKNTDSQCFIRPDMTATTTVRVLRFAIKGTTTFGDGEFSRWRVLFGFAVDQVPHRFLFESGVAAYLLEGICSGQAHGRQSLAVPLVASP